VMSQPTNPQQQLLKAAANPANEQKEARQRPPRRSMIGMQRRLEVPEIPGWHLHWFKEENVPLALDAYYEHVDKGEVKVN
ncbi:hypothetical protein ACKI1Q_45895, partial [Streptomyces galilaeus]|uniref:hypothetical protein n=1 Tax=Streptomyces galilaeus TaxID=33899 RepID=UPI0038F78F31